MKINHAFSYRSRFGVGFAVGCLIIFTGLSSPSGLAAAPALPTSTVHRDSGRVTGRVENIVTGQYLINARVVVKGTDLQAFTDETGIFKLTDVPSGRRELDIYYTGLASKSMQVDVPAGGTVDQPVFLTLNDEADVGRKTTVMDPFKVSASTATSATALAINEQRFSPNIKNVAAADAFGDITQGNVGEFIKYLPSITADFADPNIISVSVRGLPSNLTQVELDGAKLASAHTGGSTRVFQFDQVSINNLSRVEVSKEPTPADPADTLGGIINLIGKSAFESKQAEFDYRVYLTGRQGNLTNSKLPDTRDGRSYRMLPNADFSEILPINNRLGFVLSGSSANSFDERQVAARVYNATLANSGASYSAPYMQSLILQDAPRFIYRTSLNLKGDWRVTPNSVLSANVGHSTFVEYFGMNELTANTGSTALPTAGGQAMTYGPDFTNGATGRGALSLDGQYFDIRGATDLGSLRYRFDNGNWQVKAGLSRSTSTTRFRDTDDGHFYTMTSQLFGAAGFVGSPFTINFPNIGPRGPQTLDIRDTKNQPVSISDVNNFRITTANSEPRDVEAQVLSLNASVRRRINALSFPLSVEVGADQDVQKTDTRLQNIAWTYAGPDGKTATSDHIGAYQADRLYATQDDGFGYSNIAWVSPTKAYAAWQQDPTLFAQTVAQQVAAETYRISKSEVIKETVSSGYIELDGRFMQNKLRVLGGLRYEKTVDEGAGALTDPANVWERDADGSFAHDSQGAKIRRPEAGAVGSLAELQLTMSERAARAHKTYDGYFPSAHVTYNITDNLLARFEYAKTYGRPNYNQIIPNATINEADDEGSVGTIGTISVRNPGLRPWTANNYDLSLEYYTKSGGMASIGVYQKDLDGYFKSSVTTATAADLAALGLDSQYVGYQITTTQNMGKGHIHGLEVSCRQSLSVLGPWGQMFDVFANASLFKDIVELNESTVNGGVTFRLKPITFDVKANYRSEYQQNQVVALGPDAYEYEGARTTVDATLTYMLSPHLSAFLSSSNALSDNPSADRKGSLTPEYAQRFRQQNYGALYSLGIRGQF